MHPEDEHSLDELFDDGKSSIHVPSDGVEARDLDVFAHLEECALPPLDTVAPEVRHESTTLPATGDQPENWVATGLRRWRLDHHPRYRVLRLLGQGGMGAVYQAEHTLMDRPVALKVLHRHLTDSPAAADRFRREVKAAARLYHPHIVAAYDADQAEGLHFLVMEYVEGQSLGEVLRGRGRLPIAEACDYAQQAARGLQYAHEAGMVHRDIKPDNLMRTPAGRIKILDFGLARIRNQAVEPRSEEDAPPANSQLTLAGTLMGTPDYMAPEQSDDSSRADIRADIYSLGCTLYQMLTGQVPFPKGTAMERVIYHVAETATPVAELRPDVPPELVAVVEKLMAKSPVDRFQTPGEVAEALAPFIPHERPQAVGAPPVWPSRLVVALLAALAALVALALIGWLR